jgi:uncharacterized repeat protein (TIGR02543 family)
LLPLEKLNNPADPENEEYQGYPIIDDPNRISLQIPNGMILDKPEFVVSKVRNAQAYHLQIANDENFTDVVYNEPFFTSNIMEPELPKSHLQRYWRVRAKLETWGDWSEVGSFTYLHPSTVYFDSQGGSVSDPEYKTVVEGSPYGVLPTTQKIGYGFGGWWSEKGGDGVLITEDSIVNTSSGHIAYAKWSISTYTMVFDSVGGTAVHEYAGILYGVKLAEPVPPTREGYVFEGWYEEPTYINKWEFDVDIVTSNLTLYAKWRVLQVGNLGLAGGYIFYDKGCYSEGWRYLEAAPAGWSGLSEESQHIFGQHRTSPTGPNLVVGTENEIGKGNANTEALVAAMGNTSYISRYTSNATTTSLYAANICAEYSLTVDGVEYSDWFLPSRDELDLMYKNLKENDIGGFSGSYSYWSSSENSELLAWSQGFYEGNNISALRYRDGNARVRPVRAF